MILAAAGAPWWLWGLAGVGLVAVAAVLITLFVALGSRPPRLEVRGEASVASEDFLPAFTGAVGSPAVTGGTVEGLENGAEILPAILREIAAARETVHFLTYIWEPGEVATRVWDALVERAAAGVQVRLLLDGVGGFNAEEDRIRELRTAGGQVERFRPPRFGKLTRIHRRNHRRAIVIDGRVAFTGGWAVGDEWQGGGRAPGEWRESMYRVTGPLALSLQSAFAQSWMPTTGEVLYGKQFYPPSAAAEDGGDATLRHVSVVSAPTDEAHPMRKAFFLSMAGTRERLWIANAYFAPDRHLRATMRARARAGTDVRIILPSRQTDMRSVWYAGRSYYEELIADGVRIFEYQPSHMHRKVLVADGRWTVIGSANLDIRSKELNEENVLGVMDEGLGRAVEKTILEDLEHSTEIDLERWRRRGLWPRLKERFFVLFAEQM